MMPLDQSRAMNSNRQIVIVDYGMGNSGSIRNMIKKVGGDSVISADREVIAKAKKLILPGVGHYARAMQNIADRGFRKVLDHKVLEEKTPILGICLGMQLMTESSEEGNGIGFGWFKAATRRFRPERFNRPLRVPQMGWNLVNVCKPSPMFDGDGLDEHRYYFVHTFAVACADEDDVLCTSSYGYSFVSGFARDNIVGVQFHPEKSHLFGMSLMRRFVERY